MDCFVASAPRNDEPTRTFATPRHTAPELLKIFRPKEGAGNAGCALHPRSRVQDAQEDAHTSIQVQRRHSGIPCAMVLRLMPRSPRRRIRLVTVIGELAILPDPVGPEKTSADLTPATGARTTRFCRTRQRRSPGAPVIAHRPKPALQSRFTPDAVASTASLPNVADDHDAPLCGPGRRKL